MKSSAKKILQFFEASTGLASVNESSGLHALTIKNYSYIIVVGIGLLLFSSIFSIQTGLADSTTSTIGIAATVMMGGVYILMRSGVSLRLISNLVIGVLYAYFGSLIITFNYEPELISLLVFEFSIISVLLTGVKQGTTWIGVFLGSVAFGVFVRTGNFAQGNFDSNQLRDIAIIVTTTVLLTALYERSLKHYVDLLKKERHSMQHRSAQNNALISSIGDGMIALDTGGNVTFINDQAMSMLGIETIANLEHAVGNPISQVMPLFNDDGKPVDEAMQPAKIVINFGKKIDTSDTTLGGYNIKNKTGDLVPVSLVVSPMRSSGHVTGVVVIVRDTSWQHEMDRAKNEFVSLASHELRTPLTNINWNVESLLDNENPSLTSAEKASLNNIYKGSQIMTELVGALLDTSRFELGTLEMDLEQLDGVNIIQDLVDSHTHDISSKNQQIVQQHTQENVPLISDKKFFRMLFENLLTNAIKYTPEGGTITVTTEIVERHQRHKKMVFPSRCLFTTITDTGVGIPVEQQGNIFKKLFRADNVRSSSVQGTGLGLYLCHMIVEKLQGSIWFESKPGEGTTFFVYLPIYSNKEELTV
jgi:PAS domain S-box-containing protein